MKQIALNISSKRIMVAIDSLRPHSVYELLAGLSEVVTFYKDNFNRFGFTDLVIVNQKNEVLVGNHVIETAKQLELEEIEVQVVDVPEDVAPQCILFGNLYKEKNYVGITKAIDYLFDVYIKTDAGMEWYYSIAGDKEEKLAYIFGASSSTMKRFLSIAKHHRADLTMVQEGHMSWDQLKESIKKKDAAALKTVVFGGPQGEGTPGGPNVEPPTTPANVSTPSGTTVAQPEEPEEYYTGEDEGTESEGGNDKAAETTPDGNVNVTCDLTSYEFSEGTLTMLNGKKLGFTTTASGKEFTFDGKKLNIDYNYHFGLGNDNRTEYYTTMFTKGLMGDCSIQIIIDNPKKILQ